MTKRSRRDPIVEAVRADLHRRSQLGIMKYGTTLGDNPATLREKLQHAYEEALDMANYLQWAIQDLDLVLNRDPVTGLQRVPTAKSPPHGGEAGSQGLDRPEVRGTPPDLS